MAAVFRVPQRVQEAAAPHRKGTVKAVQGSGENARITVALDGWHPVTFHPAQLVHI